MASSRSKHSLGFRFHPSYKELINHLKDSCSMEFSTSPCIKLKDVFGDLEPWQIIDGEKTCYFLTRLKKFNNSNKRFSRTVGSGTWSGQTSGIPIRDKSNRNIIIGYERSLRYKSGIEKDQSEKWLLKEYFLPDEYIKKSKNKDIFAICRIKEKTKNDEENNNDDDDDDVKDEDVDGLLDYLFEGNYDQVGSTYESLIIQTETKASAAIERLVDKGYLSYLSFIRDFSIEIPPMESIPRLQEFAYVFPTDLLYVPSDRVIDLAIYLVSDTKIIYIHPYRMANRVE
ncbi:NAC domain-containing protein 53-like [Solanum tuberosum]|uniref:NAC domain-containing protein 53-like n=1 Tax=Solanum tuberosum TaxID=4113 RepID=UPI00073A1B0F|nr:PREDICTED: NAC domain-containing protein 53-like [Solanum tuberosum]